MALFAIKTVFLSPVVNCVFSFVVALCVNVGALRQMNDGLLQKIKPLIMSLEYVYFFDHVFTPVCIVLKS